MLPFDVFSGMDGLVCSLSSFNLTEMRMEVEDSGIIAAVNKVDVCQGIEISRTITGSEKVDGNTKCK